MAVSEGTPCWRHACDRPPALRDSAKVFSGPKKRGPVRSLRRGVLAAAFLGLALPVAAAEDFIVTEGMLSDDDFYRLVACGAEPGGDCTKPILHWKTERPLRVALEYMDPAFLGGRQARARAAIVRAVQYINRAGAAISMQEVPGGTEADIRVYFVDTDGEGPVAGTGIEGVDGAVVTGARVTVWSRRDTRTIREAQVIFGTRLHISHYESAMIEELTQALGLLTDIRNPAYEGVSIFSQDSNASKDLGPQDLMALRRHYPPKD